MSHDPPLLVPTIEVPGPFAIHNMPCAVCRERPAVLDLSRGAFDPCWECQENGWILTRTGSRRFQRWLRRRGS